MTTENVGMTMPVIPYYGGNYGGDMFGNGMNGLWGLIVLLAVLGYGNGGGLFGGGNNGGNGAVQRGFDQNAVMNGISNVHDAVTTGNSAMQTALCNGFAGVNQGMATGFAGVNQGVSNGFYQAEIAAGNRQMASMQQNFDTMSAFNNCCCENRLANANLMTAVAQEGANTRENCNNNNQKVMDKLCQMELDGIKQNYENRIAWMTQDYNNRIAGMQNQIDALRDAVGNARSSAAFGALGDRFQASQDAQTNALEQYLAPTPRPAYVVQNPNCCPGNFGFGGCGGYAA